VFEAFMRALFACAFAFCVFVFCAVSAHAQKTGVNGKTILGLELITELDRSTQHSFGKLRTYLSALKRSGRSCDLDTYAYGANLSCAVEGDEPILIDLEATPTRYPERVEVGEIRRGRNGKPIPSSEHTRFLKDLIGVSR
jgi:hypothetical protein